MFPKMPPTPPRPARHATGSARPVAALTRPSLVGPASPRALRIMIAGVDKDARGAVEDAVRRGLGPRADSGPRSVSVVSLAGKWSVTLDGPGDRLRGVSFVADQGRLADAIREAVDRDHAGAARGPASPGAVGQPPTEVRDRHVCDHCGQPTLVVYELQPEEPKQLAPLACPHCWKIGYVEVGAWAATGREYRAEKT
jgi:hypothetical protein